MWVSHCIEPGSRYFWSTKKAGIPVLKGCSYIVVVAAASTNCVVLAIMQGHQYFRDRVDVIVLLLWIDSEKEQHQQLHIPEVCIEAF